MVLSPFVCCCLLNLLLNQVIINGAHLFRFFLLYIFFVALGSGPRTELAIVHLVSCVLVLVVLSDWTNSSCFSPHFGTFTVAFGDILWAPSRGDMPNAGGLPLWWFILGCWGLVHKHPPLVSHKLGLSCGQMWSDGGSPCHEVCHCLSAPYGELSKRERSLNRLWPMMHLMSPALAGGVMGLVICDCCPNLRNVIQTLFFPHFEGFGNAKWKGTTVCSHW